MDCVIASMSERDVLHKSRPGSPSTSQSRGACLPVARSGSATETLRSRLGCLPMVGHLGQWRYGGSAQVHEVVLLVERHDQDPRLNQELADDAESRKGAPEM
jgi:hypothetical protein